VSNNSFYKAKSGDARSKVASAQFISLSQIYAGNKNVGSDRKHLLLGYNVCVCVIGGARMTPEPFQQTRQAPRAVMRDDRAVARASRIRILDLSPSDAYFPTS
jgi:hypothetical protein